MGRIIFFVSLYTFFFQKICAQITFTSERVKALYSTLSDSSKNEICIKRSSTFNADLFGKKFQINASLNKDSLLSHLGLDVFNLETKLIYPADILSFTERILLENLVLNTGHDLLKINKENNVHLLVNDKECHNDCRQKLLAVLPLLKDSFELDYSCSNNKSTIKLSKDNNYVQILFPSNYCVISGMDKKEYGERIFAELSEFKRSEPYVEFIPEEMELIPYKDSFWVNPGSKYLDVFSSTVYLRSNEKKELIFVFDSLNSHESFANSFLFPNKINEKIELELQMNLYGFERKKFNLKLSDFLSYFEKDCSFYFGIEKNDLTEMVGTLIIENKTLNFINLLFVTAQKSDFWSENVKIKSKLFTNIPTDNIKNLFAD
jgi:hypothetical protein